MASTMGCSAVGNRSATIGPTFARVRAVTSRLMTGRDAMRSCALSYRGQQGIAQRRGTLSGGFEEVRAQPASKFRVVVSGLQVVLGRGVPLR